MSEVKDPAIKLFGKTIPLLHNEEASGASTPCVAAHEQPNSSCHSITFSQYKNCNSVGESQEDNKKPSESKLAGSKQEESSGHPTAEKLVDLPTSCENPKTPCVDKETLSPKSSKNEEQSDTSMSQEKTLKKPDKILPCPRCRSMDTKFCYYNNYNVNQPRYFCKNCQRYWTAGGTMRNVPVGSGRRKNKSSSASHYRHIMVSEAFQAARADASNGIPQPTLSTNGGNVLTFGADAPLCESMASALNLAETSQNCVPNGDEYSSLSSVTASNSVEKGGNVGLQESLMKNFQSFPPQAPCFPGPPWPCPWNPAQWMPAIPPPAFGPPGFPMPFYPMPPYWGCTLPGSWSMPWLSLPPSSPNSPTLGKHSRDGDMLQPSNTEKEKPSKENNSENCILMPKTLRIDDPNEAAKSSIWSTLGIKNEKSTDSVSGGGLFRAFQSKGDEKNHVAETSPVLQANPAALSRSLNFHETR